MVVAHERGSSSTALESHPERSALVDRPALPHAQGPSFAALQPSADRGQEPRATVRVAPRRVDRARCSLCEIVAVGATLSD